ncbi:MAG: ribonuclease P protein component [Thermoguttaceae bacterium]|nr:ribonuclease P protein component [Thermoguttaceae bacterium]MDW8077801.1 ribonuclease P protein component [Thermoguttaceae bacterium]
MPDFSFPKKLRIRLQRDFDRLFARRVSVADQRLVVYGCENGLPYSRVAFSVPRKIGKAVRRNRWRRLLREAFRLSRHRLPQGFDYLLVARSGPMPHLKELQHSLIQLTWRLARRLAPCPPAETPSSCPDGSAGGDGSSPAA